MGSEDANFRFSFSCFTMIDYFHQPLASYFVLLTITKTQPNPNQPAGFYKVFLFKYFPEFPLHSYSAQRRKTKPLKCNLCYRQHISAAVIRPSPLQCQSCMLFYNGVIHCLIIDALGANWSDVSEEWLENSSTIYEWLSKYPHNLFLHLFLDFREFSQ